MPTIRHRVGVEAPQETVMEALTTLEGLAGWWTSDVEGNPQPDGTLHFYFGSPQASAVMEVQSSTSANSVTWRCVGGPQEWINTTITFALRQDETETIVLFTHADWVEPVEFMNHCSTKWGLFLFGMKQWLEGGESITYPKDPPLSSWR
jgi:uncharacterized protein YndB with AHSA1/START domain